MQIQHPFHLPQRRWRPQLVVDTHHLRVSRIGLWSLAKVAFVSYCCAAVLFAGAAFALWAFLHASDVIPNLEGFLGDVTGVKDFHFRGWIVFRGFAILLAGFVFSATALTVAAASFFNLFTQWTGGIEVETKALREIS